MRGCRLLLVAVHLVEATCCRCLPHGEVEVCVGLIAEDTVHRSVVRHSFVCVVFVSRANRRLFVLVCIAGEGRGYLQHFEHYLSWAVSACLG